MPGWFALRPAEPWKTTVASPRPSPASSRLAADLPRHDRTISKDPQLDLFLGLLGICVCRPRRFVPVSWWWRFLTGGFPEEDEGRGRRAGSEVSESLVL